MKYRLTYRYPAAGEKGPPIEVEADGFDLKDGGAVFYRGNPTSLTNYYPLELVRSIEVIDVEEDPGTGSGPAPSSVSGDV